MLFSRRHNHAHEDDECSAYLSNERWPNFKITSKQNIIREKKIHQLVKYSTHMHGSVVIYIKMQSRHSTSGSLF